MNYDENELLEGLKNTFKHCDHQNSDGFTFSVEASGARGGNCWGDHPNNFRISSSEMTDSIQEEIISETKNFLNMLGVELTEEKLYGKSYSLAEEIVDTPYDSRHDSEYYGNYIEYNKYYVSISEILNFLDITDEEKEKVLLISNVAKEDVLAEIFKENNYNYLNEIENKIINFEKTCSQEEKKLKDKLERTKKDIENITKNLTTFQNNKLKNLENLKKTKNDLTLLLGEEYINNQKSKKRKYGY